MAKIISSSKADILSSNHEAVKNDFIKFNVSPEFKALSIKAAQKYGMSVSELGRLLFASFITGIAQPSLKASANFDSHLKRNNRFNSTEEALDYLNQIVGD
jgi:hypothetical protein